MKLYTSTTSPYARMVMLAALARGMDELQLAYVDPWTTPAELTAINPLSQVPTLIADNGTIITNSPLILDYLFDHPFRGAQQAASSAWHSPTPNCATATSTAPISALPTSKRLPLTANVPTCAPSPLPNWNNILPASANCAAQCHKPLPEAPDETLPQHHLALRPPRPHRGPAQRQKRPATTIRPALGRPGGTARGQPVQPNPGATL